MENEQGVSYYDRTRGQVDGFTHTKPSTVVTSPPLGVGGTQTFIVQTFRVKESGDYVFIQKVDAEGAVRFVVPPAISAVIANQRDALTTKVRRAVGLQGGRAAQEKRLASGAPAFGRAK